MRKSPDGDNLVDDVTLVTEPSASRLTERQLVDYWEERRACIQWLLALGKEPANAQGYARGTVEPRSHRMEMFAGSACGSR